jgi:aconitate hydratase
MTHFPNTLKTLRTLSNHKKHFYYSLPSLEEQGLGKISRLPITIRIMLESLLRNCDGIKVKEEDVLRLAKWSKNSRQKGEVPFVVSRVLLQDFTGVPLLVDLAAMRDAVAKKGYDASLIEPTVPVDLIIDHSVQVDSSGNKDAFMFNLKLEFARNQERYVFLKWGEDAFKTFKVVPPGIGICHQVNLEFLGNVVTEKKTNDDTLLLFDTLLGTDSHTTMINGLGIVGWGVGGIEAEAAMLNQPIVLQLPDVIGVHLTNSLNEGVTATDLALRITEMLRKEGVVDKFVEFYGEGVSNLTVADRATIANMSPEYGATMAFFPVDDATLAYLRMTGRSEEKIAKIQDYLKEQQIFGIKEKDELDFTKVLELDLKSITSSVAGPKRPQDRISLKDLKPKFEELLKASIASGGYDKPSPSPKIKVHSDGKFILDRIQDSGGITKDVPATAPWSESEMVENRPFNPAFLNPGFHSEGPHENLFKHGSVVIAAITSCTNTSNPTVIIGAGLLAKKAVEKGLKVNPLVKTSLAPGSRVVTDYLEKTGLQKYLNALGFQLVAYGCTTCIGNSGPLDENIEKAIKTHDLIAASVLSGNRNFEARIHSAVKANFLMSPPLVVAFALAGRVDIDMEKEPLGNDKNGSPVFLKDIWPTSKEIENMISEFIKPSMFKQRYANILEDNPIWKKIVTSKGAVYNWDPSSTYIQNPPYFNNFNLTLPSKATIEKMRCLAIFGDSVTTDHISPAGAFHADSPAGKYLISLGVKEEDFNSYGSRRGNHEVMMRGTFANVRIKNKMMDGQEGGFTKIMPEGIASTIFEASQKYLEKQIPLIIFAGKDYGMGSSRDWAAKGTALLGIRVVVAKSFERIHRSNLIGMGVLPLQFKDGEGAETYQIKGDETFTLATQSNEFECKQEATLKMIKDGKTKDIPVTIRLDTPMEIEYYRNGGIMPYVLRQILSKKK